MAGYATINKKSSRELVTHAYLVLFNTTALLFGCHTWWPNKEVIDVLFPSVTWYLAKQMQWAAPFAFPLNCCSAREYALEQSCLLLHILFQQNFLHFPTAWHFNTTPNAIQRNPNLLLLTTFHLDLITVQYKFAQYLDAHNFWCTQQLKLNVGWHELRTTKLNWPSVKPRCLWQSVGSQPLGLGWALGLRNWNEPCRPR